MTVRPASPLYDLGARAAAELAEQEAVLGVALVGSVGRGDPRADSDVDVLVVTDVRRSASELRRALPRSVSQDARLSLLVRPTASWSADARDGALFVHHARIEGVTMYDPSGVLRTSFDDAARAGLGITREINSRSARLGMFRDVERFHGRHLFVLAQLYGIGKGVAIARCAERGELIFVKDHALQRLAVLRPEWVSAVERLRALRPFYEAVRVGQVGQLPFSPVGADAGARVTSTVRDIERLVHG